MFRYLFFAFLMLLLLHLFSGGSFTNLCKKLSRACCRCGCWCNCCRDCCCQCCCRRCCSPKAQGRIADCFVFISWILLFFALRQGFEPAIHNFFYPAPLPTVNQNKFFNSLGNLFTGVIGKL